MKRTLLTLLALASVAFAQTKSVSPTGGGLNGTDNPAFRTALGGTTIGQSVFTLTNPSAITFPRLNADNTVSALSASDFRTAIGATTIGSSVLTLTNPSAITFPRLNADNTVSALSASDFRTAIGAGTGSLTLTDSASLAATLSNETGTGLAVFGTSPTLATPIINIGSDATGDIYYRNSGGLFTRLGVGADGQVLTLASGLPSWAPSSGGATAFPLVADFTTGWINQTDKTAVDSPWGLQIVSPAYAPGTDNVGALLRPLSVASTWTYTARLKWHGSVSANYEHSGLVLRESSSGKMLIYAMQVASSDPRIIRILMNSPTSFSSETNATARPNDYYASPRNEWFFRLENNGTNIIFSISRENQIWTTISTTSKTDWITPDQIGLSIQTFAFNAASMTCTYWTGP